MILIMIITNIIIPIHIPPSGRRARRDAILYVPYTYIYIYIYIHTILYYTMLCCTILYYTILYYTILYISKIYIYIYMY